jgi:phospholipid/cholesterol/gamma-HCH transport system substrate-binding protein
MTAAPWQRGLAGLVTLVVLGGAGAQLGLTYLGFLGSDVRVEAELVSFGDALGPGAKVRYDGLIVGRVHSVESDGDGPVATLLVDAGQADAIPARSTARVLPATVFGSEYVEIVAPTRPGGDPISAGSRLAADRSEDTLRLMGSLEKSQELLRAVDVEGISRATGTLAAAIDGRGEALGEFIERADRLATTVNDDAALLYDTLTDLTRAGAVIESMLPAATRAAEHARTTGDTVVDRSDDIGALIGSTTTLAGTVGSTVRHHATAVEKLLATTDDPLRILAARTDSLAAVLAGAPGVLHNGARSVDGESIQMNGLIALDPLDPYTARDCPRYGSVAGSGCGGEMPAQQPTTGPAEPSADDVEDIQELLAGLDGTSGKPLPSPTPTPGATSAPIPGSPAPAAQAPTGLQKLLLDLLGGGAS